jgi:hypothetical protein
LSVLLMGAAVLAAPGSAWAQGSVMVPYGGNKTVPVPQEPINGPKDTPEEIAKDAQRDLKDSRFYNKPGATRAQYDADWQTCRLIARGSRTPSGTIPYYYNPAVISPLAAGIGGGIGGLIGAAIAEGVQRRENRKQCLLIKGWRLVEVRDDQQAKVAAMTDDQRSAYFDGIVGAQNVDGVVTERTSFALAPDPALALDAPVAGPASVWLGKKVDAAAPFALAPGEAAVVVAFRRPDAGSAGRSGLVQLSRYDLAGRDLVYRPKDWKKTGDKTVYSADVKSGDKKAPYEVQVVRVTPGDYVFSGFSVGPMVPTRTHCFGAPAFHVNAGEVVYLGDFIPYWNVALKDGSKVSTLAWAPHAEEARAALAAKQRALAAAMKPADWRNRATYACSAITMDRWDLPGVAELPEAQQTAAAS